jgi:hypothetical protein
MKIVAFLLVSGLSIPSPAMASKMLRSATRPDQLKEEMEFAGATIYLKHATTAGLWDNAIIAKAFNEAYNTVHKDSGYTIKSGYVANEVEIPEPAGGTELGTELGKYDPNPIRFHSYNWYNYGYNCWWCGVGKFDPIVVCCCIIFVSNIVFHST